MKYPEKHKIFTGQMLQHTKRGREKKKRFGGAMSCVLSFHHVHTYQSFLSPTHQHHHLLPTTAFHSAAWPPKPTAPIHLRGGLARSTIKCMANPRRVKMVAKQIMRELSDMLLTDKVLQFAVLPEAALGADYLSSLTTISEVEVSADLQVVKVYVSVFGDDRGEEVAIVGLKSKTKYVRTELGRRMKLRLTPEIPFIEDESLERGSRVIAILDRIKVEKEAAQSQNKEQFQSSDLPEVEIDWEGDDPDEDIIYVK